MRRAGGVFTDDVVAIGVHWRYGRNRNWGFGMLLSEAAVRGFARHESFYPRYGWFRKAYEAAARDPRIFASEDAPVRLGVGKNMVNAMRFWGLAAKIIEERPQSSGVVPTRLGHALFGGWDPYEEDPGTLWLFHWLLLAPPCLLPVWWIAFHNFCPAEFTKSDLAEAAVSKVEAEPGWTMPHPSSIEKDARVLLLTYGLPSRSLLSYGYDGPDCPLRELKLLVSSADGRRHWFRTGPKPTLPSEVVAFAALDFVSCNGVDDGTISLNRLAYEPGSPGLAFKLNETDLAAALEPTVERTNAISFVTRAGASHLTWSEDPADIALYVLEEYYYRVWYGPDVDVRLLLDAAHQRVQGRTLADILSSVDPPQPVVAARHNAQYDVRRVFFRRYVESSVEVEPLGPFSPYDGEVLLVADAGDSLPRVSRSGPRAKPVVAALPKDVSNVEAVAREIAAVNIALEDPVAAGDWTARRELREQLARARRVLEHALVAAFGADSCRWVLLKEGGTMEMELTPGRGSAALSDAADIAYSATPKVRNETLNRNTLTPTAKSARRRLLEAMIERGGQFDLGLEGWRPEVAMYRAFLERTGLHGRDGGGQNAFRNPTDESLQSAWEIMHSKFRQARNEHVKMKDVHAVLRSPPVGMKAGVVPVFVVAGLLASQGEIAVYKHGSFTPLTAELAERMADNPGQFSIGSPPDSGVAD